MTLTTKHPPPRAIIHLDLDQFFVQVARHTNPALQHLPVVIQQHDDLICISYEARGLGIKKHDRPNDIKQKYGDRVKLSHVPYSFGWKVSYRDYRIESGKIFQCIKKTLRRLERDAAAASGNGSYASSCVIERASIDEAWIDVTALAEKLTTQCNEHQIGSGEQYEWQCKLFDINSKCTTIDSYTTHLLYHTHLIAHIIRSTVADDMQYIVSAGISYNKMLAKQGSKLGKPNAQLVILPQSVQALLEQLPIHSIPRFFTHLGKDATVRWSNWLQSLGCDYSALIAQMQVDKEIARDADDGEGLSQDNDDDDSTNATTVRPPIYHLTDVQKYSVQELSAFFLPPAARWLYAAGRGDDDSPVVATTLPSRVSVSMSLTPINDWPKVRETNRWIALEIMERYKEEVVLHQRRPTVVTYAWRLQDQKECTYTMPLTKWDKLLRQHQYSAVSDLMLHWMIDELMMKQVTSSFTLRWTQLVFSAFVAVQKNNMLTMLGSSGNKADVAPEIQLYETHIRPVPINRLHTSQIRNNNQQLEIPEHHLKPCMKFIHSFNRDFYFQWRELAYEKQAELWNYYIDQNKVEDADKVEVPTAVPQQQPPKYKQTAAVEVTAHVAVQRDAVDDFFDLDVDASTSTTPFVANNVEALTDSSSDKAVSSSSPPSNRSPTITTHTDSGKKVSHLVPTAVRHSAQAGKRSITHFLQAKA